LIEGRNICCHKVILAARSAHFKKTFDTNKAAKELVVNGVKINAFMSLLEWIYTGQISFEGLSTDFVEDLLAVRNIQNLFET
jgi:hypothetical protein